MDRKEYQKQYKQQNKEKLIEYQKQYKENNKEKTKQYNKEYYKKNKDVFIVVINGKKNKISKKQLEKFEKQVNNTDNIDETLKKLTMLKQIKEQINIQEQKRKEYNREYYEKNKEDILRKKSYKYHNL